MKDRDVGVRSIRKVKTMPKMQVPSKFHRVLVASRSRSEPQSSRDGIHFVVLDLVMNEGSRSKCKSISKAKTMPKMQVPNSNSDDEASSPVKSRFKMPYCKTYEEFQLEEIQADTAALYYYNPNDYLSISSGGKDRRTPLIRHMRERSNPFSKNNATSSNSSNLDFKVLSLDEIRMRKKQASVSEKSKTKSDERFTEEFLKNAIKTLEKLKAMNKKDLAIHKRKFGELEEPEDDRVTMIQKVSVKIPPIKLRRVQTTKRSPNQTDIPDKTKQNAIKYQESEAEQRLISEIDNELGLDPRMEVQVGVCDSSTPGDESEEPLTKLSVAIETTQCHKLAQVYDRLIIVNGNDILKDIDQFLNNVS